VWAGPIALVAVDVGTGQERVLMGSLTHGASVALSPDQRTLALEWVEGARKDAKLHVARVSVDGSDYRELLSSSDLSMGTNVVAWDRDGRSILFAREQMGGVMRVPAGGGAPTPVSAVVRGIFDLSPDGSRIAYSTYETANEVWALDNILPMLN
jgi:Tol biopolymer transport system component